MLNSFNRLNYLIDAVNKGILVYQIWLKMNKSLNI